MCQASCLFQFNFRKLKYSTCQCISTKSINKIGQVSLEAHRFIDRNLTGFSICFLKGFQKSSGFEFCLLIVTCQELVTVFRDAQNNFREI